MPGPPHVLVVEDDPEFLDLIFDVLEADGYRVSRARSTGEALERAARARPDVILVDVAWGTSAADGVRQEFRERGLGDIPLLVVSADGSPQRAARAGAEAFLAKPFDIEALLAEVASMTSR